MWYHRITSQFSHNEKVIKVKYKLRVQQLAYFITKTTIILYWHLMPANITINQLPLPQSIVPSQACTYLSLPRVVKGVWCRGLKVVCVLPPAAGGGDTAGAHAGVVAQTALVKVRVTQRLRDGQTLVLLNLHHVKGYLYGTEICFLY